MNLSSKTCLLALAVATLPMCTTAPEKNSRTPHPWAITMTSSENVSGHHWVVQPEARSEAAGTHAWVVDAGTRTDAAADALEAEEASSTESAAEVSESGTTKVMVDDLDADIREMEAEIERLRESLRRLIREMRDRE